ncbi:MAG TPA: NAD(+)/NADH kinase [Candidatus Poseidoniaceae archaeon]|nr:NAD(+)/NADH kinase [Candidatus Poseidoniaceae archaeon]
MTDILLVYKKNFEAVHDISLGMVTKALEDASNRRGGLRIDIRAREQVRRADFIGRDLVLVLGGDGTLTSISHNIDAATPVMGINSHPRTEDPHGSFGFYMDSNLESFAEDLETALNGDAIVNELPRLQAIIDTTSGNRFTTDPAMNDLLIANTHQYAPSKYHLRRGENKCLQQSSGLLFSTWLGQGAWLRNAAGEGDLEQLLTRVKKQQISTHYFVIARDIAPVERKGMPWSWMDWTEESTTITSDMHRGYVVPDGWDEVHFNRGATITVNAEAPILRLLTFRRSMIARLDDSMV